MTGRLEVICGPMFSGKTEELIRRITRAEFAGQAVGVWKPLVDTRYERTQIVSHSGSSHHGNSLDDIAFLKQGTKPLDVVGIDEVQFFPRERTLVVIDALLSQGKTVIVAGLDNTFRQEPFGAVPDLMRLADSVTKLTAVCHVCKADAIFTQRLVDGKPASFSGPTVQIGALDSYEARCRECFRRG